MSKSEQISKDVISHSSKTEHKTNLNSNNFSSEIDKSVFATPEEAIDLIRKGEIIILVDDESRENEGDMVVAAQFITPEKVNFITKWARGLLCVAISKEIAERLNLFPMVANNNSLHGTAFTVSVDAKEGVSTGISAHDRALTIKKIADPNSKPDDFVRPGHIFPIVAREGGVLVRAGHTEGSTDLCKLADLIPAAAICEIMNEDGSMARLPDLINLAKRFGLKIAKIEDIIRYRLKRESFVRKVVEARLPTEFGEFKIQVWENILDGSQNTALIKGEINPEEPTLVRVHSECLTGDVFGSLRCDCGPQLKKAMEMISKEGKGVIVYIRRESMEKSQEGRGIGLIKKLEAYNLQDQGLDTVEANLKLGFPPDLRDYGIGAQILKGIGVGKIRLMTNNPRKIVGLKGYGLEISEIVPIKIQANPENERYIKAKKEKLNHLI
jgi:3,4-dihydroxy 2-butanone 4-phosphate synthase/GTP cyclohydrolase II